MLHLSPSFAGVVNNPGQDPPEETCHYWLVAKPGLEVDFCFTDPQLNVDLFIVAELRAITAALSGPQSAALATPA